MNNVKCDNCGQFISWVDFQNFEVATRYDPLNEFGPEGITFSHKGCVRVLGEIVSHLPDTQESEGQNL